jgi:hypothetical protein
LSGVNRHTATLFFRKLREVIAQRLNEEAPGVLGAEAEIDESYFGGHHKGKWGRGTGGKVPVFGLLKRGGKVHTLIIPNAGSKMIFPIIRARIRPDAVVYSDSFQAYDVLDVSEFHPPCASTIASSSSTGEPTSTASRTSGTKPSAIYAAIMASQEPSSPSTPRNANGASIAAPQTACSQP